MSDSEENLFYWFHCRVYNGFSKEGIVPEDGVCKFEVGDEISVKVDNITSTSSLVDPGDEVQILFYKNGKLVSFDILLIELTTEWLTISVILGRTQRLGRAFCSSFSYICFYPIDMELVQNHTFLDVKMEA